MAELSLPEVATAAQLAEFLHTTEASLAQDRYLQRGVPYTRVGRRIRYLREDVMAFLNANKINGEADIGPPGRSSSTNPAVPLAPRPQARPLPGGSAA